ncbi:hypothetical protein HMPREF1624_08710 [Sporothrix schenckii ATCC 58251]|uniref:DNA-directed RNA polymerase n=1 Tax=Sporothrix schenckii (strain ATCC 58251 / de Perez 2211183) TaxID=1391915 RepID=U7PHE9_SPOS1|nr:hypothetical protein HMPREF1624_08710 [Sporothrix schenckii ATCC 58251]
MRAFTCGIDDLRLTPEGEANRSRELNGAQDAGLGVAAAYVSLKDQAPTDKDPELLRRLEDVMRDDSKQEGLDLLMNKMSASVSSNVTKACLPVGLEKPFPHNHMQAMTISGAKGGNVNANLISCNLGQQVLEGRRVPLMVSGKSLPCFPEFDTSLRAGGYIVNRFLTGIRPQEYYFHHMAGREGLIDTAVKTSRSGYLQRCLIKGMEGLEVAYDSSVRDSDGSLVQFLYGEDGLDVTKQKYLTDFSFVLHNLESEMSDFKFSDPRTAGLFEHKDEFFKQSKRMLKRSNVNAGFADEPVNALVNPAKHAFAMSEKFFGLMSTYVRENKDRLIKDKESRGDDQSTSPSDVLDTVEKRLLPVLRKLITKATKQNEKGQSSASIPDVGVKAGVIEVSRTGNEDSHGNDAQRDDGSDDDNDDGDNDATSAKQRGNRNEAVSYGPNDEEDDDIRIRMERDATTEEDLPDDEGYVGSPRSVMTHNAQAGENERANDSEASDEEDSAQPGGDVQGDTEQGGSEARQARVKSGNTNITRFRADENAGEWCEFTLELPADSPKILMLSVVEDAVRRSVVRQIPGVKSCTYVADEVVKDSRTGIEVKVPVVHTEGANIRTIQQFSDFFDPNKLATNDIVAMLEVYGVEACRNTIIRELSTVFVSHGIGVDNRHLNLIGDFMTRGGGFMPFNRYGLKGNVSPFTKMSFETTLAFLKDALVDGDWDGLVTPSSRIVMGRLGKTGTGSFDVLTSVPIQHFDPMQGLRTS